MSKASDEIAHKAPAWKSSNANPGGLAWAAVSSDNAGAPEMMWFGPPMCSLAEADALSLAHWIIDTFGDESAQRPSGAR